MKPINFLLVLSILPSLLAAQEIYFPPVNALNWEVISLEDAGFCAGNEQELYDYLEETNTDAFLLLKDGKIVIERYFGDFNRFSPHVWNSAGKSLMAFTAGIAASLDSLDIQRPVSDYLGEGWTDCPEREPAIRVINQLTMTTGLSDQTGEVNCTSPECLVCLALPGERWAYHNGPYTLLGEVIEAAVDQDLNDFIDERIQSSTGMTGQFTYFGDNRIYISNARSMARFGLLVLNEGNWDGTPVLDNLAYLEAMTNSSQNLNPAYGYLWWLNGKAEFQLPTLQFAFSGPLMNEAPAATIAALGKDGQILNVVASEGLVMVRMGDSPGESVPVPTFYNDSIWLRINALRCPTSSEDRSVNDSFQLSPNPAGREVNLKASGEMRRVMIYGSSGNLLREEPVDGTQATLSLSGLPEGVLFILTEFADGSQRWRRVVRR